jgi:hypothetical protein
MSKIRDLIMEFWLRCKGNITKQVLFMMVIGAILCTVVALIIYFWWVLLLVGAGVGYYIIKNRTWKLYQEQLKKEQKKKYYLEAGVELSEVLDANSGLFGIAPTQPRTITGGNCYYKVVKAGAAHTIFDIEETVNHVLEMRFIRSLSMVKIYVEVKEDKSHYYFNVVGVKPNKMIGQILSGVNYGKTIGYLVWQDVPGAYQVVCVNYGAALKYFLSPGMTIEVLNIAGGWTSSQITANGLLNGFPALPLCYGVVWVRF